MSNTVLVSVLAAGLAIALARENRFRRALQGLCARLITTLRATPATSEYRQVRPGTQFQHSHHVSHRRHR